MGKNPNQIPSFEKLMVPTLRALKTLGGSGNVDEIYEVVAVSLGLPDELLDVMHGDTSRTEIQYRLAWARTYLKKYGLLENSVRSIWALVDDGLDISRLDPKAVVKVVRDRMKPSAPQNVTESLELGLLPADPEIEPPWHRQLHDLLLKMSPDAFERLAQRLLRESGFVQVEVTGKSGDGGIDGIGIARIAGFLSFHVLFQCKRYVGAVTPAQIRDFRGAMQGRTDKGLFITTGTFTREAVKEATRDGAPPIDLIDGEQLVQRLKELNLGVTIRLVEAIEVNQDWFSKI